MGHYGLLFLFVFSCEEKETACDAGMQRGGDGICEKILCDANTYVQDAVCVSCPAGTSNEAGDWASEGNTSCDSCSEIDVEGGVCIACDDLWTCTDVLCDAGYLASEIGDSCEVGCPVANDETLYRLVGDCLAYNATGDCNGLYTCDMNMWDV